jgi:tRNA (guanine26-N2/guanine27-N2)-dimethyltransferase
MDPDFVELRDLAYSPTATSFEANFTSHPLTVTQASKVKLVRYQQNPTPNWGPATKAESGTKRKRHDKDE